MKPKFSEESSQTWQERPARSLAGWITSQDHPFFAKSVANRIWAHFTGVGIVNPVDDFRASNPPSNPELLDELARRLVEYKYDTKQLVRDICNSQTYQRSVTPVPGNEDDTRNYSHVLFDEFPQRICWTAFLKQQHKR